MSRQPVSYQRVLPRDLFNEAKLLKCLGQLVLLIEDRTYRLKPTPAQLVYSHDGKGFDIRQHPFDGSLWCTNLEFFFRRAKISVASAYNSKDAYPLEFDCANNPRRVFNEEGSLSDDFIAFLEEIKE